MAAVSQPESNFFGDIGDGASSMFSGAASAGSGLFDAGSGMFDAAGSGMMDAGSGMFDSFEVKMPELNMPDLAMPDVSLPDVAMPEGMPAMPDLAMPEFKLPEGMPAMPPFPGAVSDLVPSEESAPAAAAPAPTAAAAVEANDKEPETKNDDDDDDDAGAAGAAALAEAEAATSPLLESADLSGDSEDASSPSPQAPPQPEDASGSSSSSSGSAATWDTNAASARASAEDPALLALGAAGSMSPSDIEAIAYKFNECTEALGTPELSKPAFKMLVKQIISEDPRAKVPLPKDLDIAFVTADEDKNGTINLPEFLHLVSLVKQGHVKGIGGGLFSSGMTRKTSFREQLAEQRAAAAQTKATE